LLCVVPGVGGQNPGLDELRIEVRGADHRPSLAQFQLFEVGNAALEVAEAVDERLRFGQG
jgi:hypothetical protein